MKLAFILLIIGLLVISCQEKKEVKHSSAKADKREIVNPFNFHLTTWGSASLVMDGYSNYLLTDTSIQIYKEHALILVGCPIDTNFVYYKKINNQEAQLFFSKIKLAHLEDSYVNRDIMITSGQHFQIKFKNPLYKKEIDISNYCLDEMLPIVEKINEIVPKEYQIRYDASYSEHL